MSTYRFRSRTTRYRHLTLVELGEQAGIKGDAPNKPLLTLGELMEKALEKKGEANRPATLFGLPITSIDPKLR